MKTSRGLAVSVVTEASPEQRPDFGRKGGTGFALLLVPGPCQNVTLWFHPGHTSQNGEMSVLGFLSMWQNTVSKAAWGGKVYLALASVALFIIEGSQDRNNRAGTCRQDLRQRAWRSVVYWLAPHGCSPCFVFFNCIFLSENK